MRFLVSRHWKHLDRCRMAAFGCLNGVAPHVMMDLPSVEGVCNMMQLYGISGVQYLQSISQQEMQSWIEPGSGFVPYKGESLILEGSHSVDPSIEEPKHETEECTALVSALHSHHSIRA